jgi:hypothetical protein
VCRPEIVVRRAASLTNDEVRRELRSALANRPIHARRFFPLGHWKSRAYNFARIIVRALTMMVQIIL